ncbi:hypothetical protein HG530_003520 [Fusarium avenaceum]|nr:hypothetical protein HG530_003520 [Fusarium avenaceum]
MNETEHGDRYNNDGTRDLRELNPSLRHKATNLLCDLKSFLLDRPYTGTDIWENGPSLNFNIRNRRPCIPGEWRQFARSHRSFYGIQFA